jgi:hypothetical protein
MPATVVLSEPSSRRWSPSLSVRATQAPGAFGGQQLGDRLADAAAGAGHDRHPTGHFRHGCLPLTVET